MASQHVETSLDSSKLKSQQSRLPKSHNFCYDIDDTTGILGWTRQIQMETFMKMKEAATNDGFMAVSWSLWNIEILFDQSMKWLFIHLLIALWFTKLVSLGVSICLDHVWIETLDFDTGRELVWQSRKSWHFQKVSLDNHRQSQIEIEKSWFCLNTTFQSQKSQSRSRNLSRHDIFGKS